MGGGRNSGMVKDVTPSPQEPQMKASPAQPFQWVQICRTSHTSLKKIVQTELKKKKKNKSWGKY